MLPRRIAFICIALLPTIAWGQPVLVDPPVPAKIIVRQDKKPGQTLDGMLTAWDADSLTVKTKDDERTLQWTELTGNSAYQLRVRLIDRKDAHAWLDLAALAWGLGDRPDARIAVSQVLRIDPGLKNDTDALQASTAGILLDPVAPKELIHDARADAMKSRDPAVMPKYLKTSFSEAKTGMAETRADAAKVADAMHIKFHELQTPHFLIFTDWGPESDGFLQENLEAAYKVVSHQFDIPNDENVFVGKLGVFMFATHDEFLKSGQKFDKLPVGDKGKNIVGYYVSQGQVVAHLATSKPDAPADASGAEIRTEWAYVLTHEFTHAFVARYRSPRHIPTWINEGIAEVVASLQFPRDVKVSAARMAHSPLLATLFDDKAGIQPGTMYPVMRTLTEVLLLKDPQKFLKMFDELKTGVSGAQALKDNYGWTFSDLETYWRKYLGVQ